MGTSIQFKRPDGKETGGYLALAARADWREDALVARFVHEIQPQLDPAELEIAPLLEIAGEHRVPASVWERVRARFAA